MHKLAAAHLIFDFDLTLVSTESVSDVLDLVLADRGKGTTSRRAALQAAATRAREGVATTKDIFLLTKTFLSFRHSDFEAYVRQTRATVGNAIKDIFSALRSDGVDIQILSSSYRELIEPLASDWGVAAQYVTANRLLWLGSRPVAVLPSPLHRTEGKNSLIATWRRHGRFNGPVIMVGDGLADYLPYENGLVQGFVSADYYNRPLQNVSGQYTKRAARLDEVVPAVRSLLEALREY